MPIQRIGFCLGVCILLAGALGGQSPAKARQAIGLVLEAKDASLLRSGQGLRPAVQGTLLFTGDTIVTAAAGTANIAWCVAGRTAQGYSIGADASLRMDDPPAGAPATQTLPDCELPELPPSDAAFTRPTGATPSPESAGAPTKLTALELLALVSRATRLARAGQNQEASQEFARVDAALQDVGQGWAKEMRVETSAKAAPVVNTPGETFAVVIGISDYTDPKLKLHFARRDAEHMLAFLQSPRGGSVKAANTEVLLDKQADRPHVQAALEKAFRRQAGRVVVFISAHGVLVNNKPYLVTWDCPLGNGPEKCYPMSELIGLIRLNQPHIGRVELYVDACRLATPDPVSELNRVNTNVATTLDAIPGRRIALFASAELAYEHQVFDDGKGHGAFTYHLLKGLNDPPPSYLENKQLSLGELIRFIMDGVPVTTRKHQYPADRVSELSKPTEIIARFDATSAGIEIGSATVMPADAFKTTKGEADFSKVTPPQHTEPWVQAEAESLAILQRYLDGDEVPQQKSDFMHGAELTEEALRRTPDSAELAARLEFFRARAALFDAKDAAQIAAIRDQLEKAIRLDPENAVAYNALGIVYLEQAEYDKARECFDDAIRRSPYWAYPRHNRALALSEKGDYAGAEREYLMAIRQASVFSYLPYNLGLLYQRMNRTGEASRAYRCAGYLIRQRAAAAIVDAKGRNKASCPEGNSFDAPLSVRLGAADSDNPVRVVAPDLALGVLKNDPAKIRSVIAELQQTKGPATERYLITAQHDLAVVLARKRKGWTEAEAIWDQLVQKDYAPSRLALADHLLTRARKTQGAERQDLLARARAQYQALLDQQPNNAEIQDRIRRLDQDKR